MSTPPLGREAVVLLDTVEVGYAEKVKESVDASLIKKYKLGSDKPAVLKSGNKTFRVEFGAMYIDKAYAEKVLNGTAVTIEVRPNGTGTGKEKHTYTGVILSKWGFEVVDNKFYLRYRGCGLIAHIPWDPVKKEAAKATSETSQTKPKS